MPYILDPSWSSILLLHQEKIDAINFRYAAALDSVLRERGVGDGTIARPNYLLSRTIEDAITRIQIA
jgi:hypothetical protein